MKTSIEVTKATALMIEAMQKRYEAVCLAVDAIEYFCGVSDKQTEELCDKIYESSWGFEDALWQLFCDMARDKALSEVKDGKIFAHI